MQEEVNNKQKDMTFQFKQICGNFLPRAVW